MISSFELAQFVKCLGGLRTVVLDLLVVLDRLNAINRQL